MANITRLATEPEEYFGLVVAKVHQLSALLQAIRKGADLRAHVTASKRTSSVSLLTSLNPS
jgi:hypothetical protein